MITILESAGHDEWAAWMAGCHTATEGVWLRIAKNGSTAPSVSYPEALEVALSYGWIGGQRRGESYRTYLQWFGPRAKKSIGFEVNRAAVGSGSDSLPVPLAILLPAIFTLLCLAPLKAQQPALFDYDRSAPFQYQQEIIRTDPHVEIAGAGIPTPTGKLNLLVVRPRGKGPFPAVIFQHGGGTSMLTYLAEAALLARAGALSLILDAPAVDPKRKPIEQMTGAELRDYNAGIVICERRAVDYLANLSTVDRTRIAFVGHSYGGITGGVLAGIEPRIRAFVLIGAIARYTQHVAENPADVWVEWRKRNPAGQLAEALRQFRPIDPDQYVNAAHHGPILIQCGNFDFANREPCTALFAAASSPKEVRWYDTDHEFADIEATIDRLKFLEQQLRLKPIRRELDRLVTAPRKQLKSLAPH